MADILVVEIQTGCSVLIELFKVSLCYDGNCLWFLFVIEALVCWLDESVQLQATFSLSTLPSGCVCILFCRPLPKRCISVWVAEEQGVVERKTSEQDSNIACA